MRIKERLKKTTNYHRNKKVTMRVLLKCQNSVAGLQPASIKQEIQHTDLKCKFKK